MSRRPGLILLTVCSTVLVSAALLGSGRGADPQAAQPASGEEVKQLRESLKTLMEEHRKLSDVVSQRARTDPPIGTIVAFVGAWPPAGPRGESWSELELGWVLCDGRKLSDVEAALREQAEKLREKVPQGGFLQDLAMVLPGPRTTVGTLPDLQGYFLRGYDPKGLRDRGTLVHGNQRQLGELGVEQLYTTALPREAAFKTGNQSANPTSTYHRWIHHYVYSTGRNQSASYFDNNATQVATSGNHTHDVASGGDQETRPTNKAVNWIIKFR